MTSGPVVVQVLEGDNAVALYRDVMGATNPANAATNVPLNQAVSATFTKAMHQLTITTGTFQLTGPGGTAIAGTVSYDAIDFIATFTPKAALLANTTYTATVTNGATDQAGNPLGNTGAPNPWAFTTGAAVIPPPVVLGSTVSLFGAFGGTAGITNQGIHTVINGDIRDATQRRAGEWSHRYRRAASYGRLSQ